MNGPVTELERLDDTDFHRVLVVVAHPDDPEYGISAVVSQWVERGVEVAYLLMTHGEAGMQRDPELAGPLRAAEQRAACTAVGVEDLTILDFPDGHLTYGLDLRRAIARRLRQFRPDVVVTGGWDVMAGWGLDQADHRVVGLATLDAIRDADNTWVHPELARDEELPKWGVTWLLLASSPSPTHYVEVGEGAFAKAVASLSAHRAYLADLPWHPAPQDLLTMALGHSETTGVPRAQRFQVHRMAS